MLWLLGAACLGLAGAVCGRLAPSEAGWCGRYVAPYADSVYFSGACPDATAVAAHPPLVRRRGGRDGVGNYFAAVY